MNGSGEQYLIFLKYTREYLSQVTGYSKGHISRVVSGNREPSEIFIGVCCHTLKEPKEDLFRLIEPHKPSLVPSPPRQPDQDLLDTIDELGDRLTKCEAEVKELRGEFNKYG